MSEDRPEIDYSPRDLRLEQVALETVLKAAIATVVAMAEPRLRAELLADFAREAATTVETADFVTTGHPMERAIALEEAFRADVRQRVARFFDEIKIDG